MLLHRVNLIGNMLRRNSSINIDQLALLTIVVLQRSGEGVVGFQTPGQSLLVVIGALVQRLTGDLGRRDGCVRGWRGGKERGGGGGKPSE